MGIRRYLGWIGGSGRFSVGHNSNRRDYYGRSQQLASVKAEARLGLLWSRHVTLPSRHQGERRREPVGLPFSTATSLLGNHLATDQQVGDEPCPRLDAGGIWQRGRR
jgi:hypothetical protein